MTTEMQPATRSSGSLQPRAAVTPMDMLNMAVQQGADLDKLSKLMDLQERWETNEARKAFVQALNAFKANPPTLVKNRHVSYQGAKGRTEYDHATLDHVSDEIGKALAAQGLSHRWDVDQIDGGLIRVTCVLTHEQGHSERVSLQAGADQSGGKNNIQAIGSAVSYLQRYTLLAATGLAAKDQDDDGQAAGQPRQQSSAPAASAAPAAQPSQLTPNQVEQLTDLLKATGTPEARLLAFAFAGSVPEGAKLYQIPQTMFPRCLTKLSATLKQKKAKEQGARSENS